MTEIYLHFIFAHYVLYGNAPVLRCLMGLLAQIYVDTPMLALMYLGDPEKTAERFPTLEIDGKPLKLYRTGDAGRVMENGELECLGRIDSTVKIRGFKVSIPFVESVIKEQEGVTSAAVMPITEETAVVGLVAYVVGSGTDLMSEEELAILKVHIKRNSSLPGTPYYDSPFL